MSKFILNTLYIKPKWYKNQNSKNDWDKMIKYADDALILTIKDDVTNTSELQIIERPTIPFYTIKEEITPKPYNEMYMDMNLLDEHFVEYSKRELEICKYLGVENEYKRLKSNKWLNGDESRNEFNNFINENIAKSPYIYGADVDIEDYHKTKFILENGDGLPETLNISMFDIETYIYKFKENINQKNTKAPINIVTYVNTKTKMFYALVLKLPDIPVILEVEKDIESYLKEYVIQDFIDNPELSIKVIFYDDEPNLIISLFRLIHADKPDFCLAWNSNYDYLYIINRAIMLGLDPKDLFCHPDVPERYRQFKYVEDYDRINTDYSKKNKKHFSRYWDWVHAPGYTIYIDQMSLYSNLRKRYMETSYSLKHISNKENVNTQKLDLKSYKLTIKNAPFRNFKVFLKYSILDTYLLYKIENKNQDLKMLLSLAANTKLEHATNISFIIKNAFYHMFLKENKMIGNTIDYGVYESIDGAIVADPLLLDSYPIKIDNRPTAIYKYVTDFDGKSEYPSLMIQFRIGKNTIFTRIVCIKDESGIFIMSGQEFNQMLQTKRSSIITLGNKLYGLPNIEDILSDLESKIMN